MATSLTTVIVDTLLILGECYYYYDPELTCWCVCLFGAVEQRAEGQACEDHGCHHLIHIHFLCTPIVRGETAKLLVFSP